jgi:hypothetical protein
MTKAVVHIHSIATVQQFNTQLKVPQQHSIYVINVILYILYLILHTALHQAPVTVITHINTADSCFVIDAVSSGADMFLSSIAATTL